jgi:hypothetical protein
MSVVNSEPGARSAKTACCKSWRRGPRIIHLSGKAFLLHQEHGTPTKHLDNNNIYHNITKVTIIIIVTTINISNNDIIMIISSNDNYDYIIYFVRGLTETKLINVQLPCHV